MEFIKGYNWNIDIFQSKDVKIKNKIGAGGFGTVFRGTLNNKEIICKNMYVSEYDSILDLFENAEQEIYNYTKLKGCNQCCKLIGLSWNDETESLSLLLKDYKVIGDLHDYINESRFWTKYSNENYSKNFYTSEWDDGLWIYHMIKNKKIGITLSLCDALEELHGRDVVHCDLKTNNTIYSEKDNKIILIDFNASTFMNQENYERISRNCGTVGYTCKTLNGGVCHKKVDIYSLAICILEVWCGSIWDGSDDHRGCRLEVLKYMRILEKKGHLEKQLGKVLREAINCKLDKRPYIKTFKKKITTILTE